MNTSVGVSERVRFGNYSESSQRKPCTCKAWSAFSKKRTQMQETTKKLLERLNYTEKTIHNRNLFEAK
ncbi:hypothetical protein [Anaerosporobacter faecicola]|uniref:hypothetical protein n=1 Tax=Anaerosporobacter faecicola TaxID=2718714 RepID=UPI00143B12F8|nr:hypothetical protein [Anaerosporobacter faecicola]